MASVEQQYTKELRNGLGYLATWLPGMPIFLGDVGLIDDGVFKRVSHLQPLGVGFKTQKDRSTDRYEYQSSGKISVEMSAKGESAAGFSHISDAEAGIAVTFKDEKAVVLSAEGVRSDLIKDLDALETSIRERSDVWDPDWVVVTEVVTAASSTVLISNSSDSRIELKATGSVGSAGLKLADADAKLQIAMSRGLHTQIVSATGLTPLFRGVKVRFGIDFWGRARHGIEMQP